MSRQQRFEDLIIGVFVALVGITLVIAAVGIALNGGAA